jgi:hypothetical protein
MDSPTKLTIFACLISAKNKQPQRTSRFRHNGYAHQTQITFATQPINLGRSGAAACYMSAFKLR